MLNKLTKPLSLLIFFFTLLISFLLFPQELSLAETTKGSVVQIGDSLTVGMVSGGGIIEKYQAAGLTPVIPGNNPSGTGGCADGYKSGYPCHGLAGGSSPTGIEALDANSDALKSASAVVMQMGTNRVEANDSDAFKNAMNIAIDKIRAFSPNAKIFWVNLAVKKTHPEISNYSTRNKTINEVAAAKNITVIDWFKVVYPSGDAQNMSATMTGKDEWFASDGIHYTGEGYNALADTVVSNVSNGGGGSGGGYITVSSVACSISKVGSPQGSPPPLPAECKETSQGGSRPTIRDKNGGVCPVPGTITCGPSQPQTTNYGGGCETGHCGTNYCALNGAGACGAGGYCNTAPATAYASDVDSPAGTEVQIPTLYISETKENHDLTCESRGPAATNSGSATETICQYNCQDKVNNQRVWLQFHHNAPGSCATTGSMVNTGGHAGTIWSGGNHTHVQIGVGGECGGGGYSSCVPADKYLPCN